MILKSFSRVFSLIFFAFLFNSLNAEENIDIWKNKKYERARKQLLNSNRNFNPCKKCDVEGSLIGNKHAKEWLKKI